MGWTRKRGKYPFVDGVVVRSAGVSRPPAANPGYEGGLPWGVTQRPDRVSEQIDDAFEPAAWEVKGDFTQVRPKKDDDPLKTLDHLVPGSYWFIKRKGKTYALEVIAMAEGDMTSTSSPEQDESARKVADMVFGETGDAYVLHGEPGDPLYRDPTDQWRLDINTEDWTTGVNYQTFYSKDGTPIPMKRTGPGTYEAIVSTVDPTLKLGDEEFDTAIRESLHPDIPIVRDSTLKPGEWKLVSGDPDVGDILHAAADIPQDAYDRVFNQWYAHDGWIHEVAPMPPMTKPEPITYNPEPEGPDRPCTFCGHGACHFHDDGGCNGYKGTPWCCTCPGVDYDPTKVWDKWKRSVGAPETDAQNATTAPHLSPKPRYDVPAPTTPSERYRAAQSPEEKSRILLEVATGIDLFSKLPDEVARVLTTNDSIRYFDYFGNELVRDNDVPSGWRRRTGQADRDRVSSDTQTVPAGMPSQEDGREPARNRPCCPDGGKCHHECTDGNCYRRSFCAPLSGVFPNDEWPVDKRNWKYFECSRCEAVVPDFRAFERWGDIYCDACLVITYPKDDVFKPCGW